MIDLVIKKEPLASAVKRARERRIVVPTLAQQKDPAKIPEPVHRKLRDVGLWDVDPLNLFRITWKNEPVESGGGFGGVNFIELPSELTGVDARIICLVGKWFPTGSHKVGATFGCLVPRLVTGQFDPIRQKAVWPSTGNFCRGGAYNAALLACESIAILPEEMSTERFEWLSTIAGEVIRTPGSESNVKEIFDKCWALRKTRSDIVIFNQFEEFGNYLWHYEVTGPAIEEVLLTVMAENDRFAGVVSSTGSAGTIASGDYLKGKFPGSRVAAAEALQCPTLLMSGFGSHRIEGIGDKHIPWIHNVRNTDLVIAVDDNHCMDLLRLFNEPSGREFLADEGLSDSAIANLSLLGLSGICNVIAAVKFAKYFDLTKKDVVVTILTDSVQLYESRIRELRERFGGYTRADAVRDYHRSLAALGIDHMLELSYHDRKRIHNLKYFTWVEQQGRSVHELNAQWHEYPDYWNRIPAAAPEIDRLIREFNTMTGLSFSKHGE